MALRAIPPSKQRRAAADHRLTNGDMAIPDAYLQAAIVAIRQQHPAYGYRRVTQALRDTAIVVNQKR